MPKSMNDHSIPSRVYSSCSRTNMWWLKNCCNFSFVKLMQSCSNPLYCGLFYGMRGLFNIYEFKKVQKISQNKLLHRVFRIFRILLCKNILRVPMEAVRNERVNLREQFTFL
jgi:hypothetical protein